MWVVVRARQRAGASDSPEWRTILWHLDVLGVCVWKLLQGSVPSTPPAGSSLDLAVASLGVYEAM